jgi:hypothetical protein
MLRQLIAMEMGMGIMPGRQCRFCLRVVGWMGIDVAHGMMFFFLIMAFLVLAGLRPGLRLRVTDVLLGFVSW